MEREVYRLIISRLKGDRLKERTYREEIELEAKKGIGGFVVFGGQRQTLKGFIRHLKEVYGGEIIFAADVERGLSPILKGGSYFPRQMAVCAAWKGLIDRDVLIRGLKRMAAEVRECGIDMALIPVLDVNREGKNPIIGTRAFSDDPMAVAELGSIYIDVLQGEGLFCCAKHFPGHGLTVIDSHKALPVVEKSDVFEKDLWPFKRAIERGVSSIMAGHISFPFLDREPASLSRIVIGKILRERMGFEGVVLTDALTMGALDGQRDICVRALLAGNDVLLLPRDPHRCSRRILRALDEGVLQEKEIMEKVERLKRLWKGRKNGKGRRRVIRGDPVRELTEGSLTLIKGSVGPFSLSEYSVFLCGIEAMCRTSLLKRLFKEWKGERKVIVAIFTEHSSTSEQTDLEEETLRRLRELIRGSDHAIVVSFGNPYVLSHLEEAHVLIAAYDGHELVQDALVRALKGEIGFSGRLPISLN
jgi:beta-glucosidase-like glycosyl hydrolase